MNLCNSEKTTRFIKVGAHLSAGSFKQGPLEYEFIKAGAPLSAGLLKQRPLQYKFINTGAPLSAFIKAGALLSAGS